MSPARPPEGARTAAQQREGWSADPARPPEGARTAAQQREGCSADPARRARTLVISCEHGGNDVPLAYRALFAGHEDLLASHRGWDPGALQLARDLAAAGPAPLFAATTTRLLVDLNRSIGHAQLFSALTRGLPRAQRDALIADHYRPHRDAVEGEVARRIAAGESVLHVAVHSFTPVLDGQVRRADIGWLYDPQRDGEAAFASRWMAAVGPLLPGLRLRRNNPYRGRSDGLAQTLRRRWSPVAYLGYELEVNQRFVQAGGAPWQALRAGLVASLQAARLATCSVPQRPG